MTETMWRCDQVRAGRLYNRMMFDTREEAEQFVQRMQQMEPDQMFSIEPWRRSRSGTKLKDGTNQGRSCDWRFSVVRGGLIDGGECRRHCFLFWRMERDA